MSNLTKESTIRNLMLAAFNKGIETSLHMYKRIFYSEEKKVNYVSTQFSVTVWNDETLPNGTVKHIPVTYTFENRLSVSLFLANLIKNSDEVLDTLKKQKESKLKESPKKVKSKFSKSSSTKKVIPKTIEATS